MDPSAINREVRRFFDSYCRAFERQEAAAIADHYAYPAHVTSDTGSVALVQVTSKENWTAKLEELVSMYRQIRFRSARVMACEVTELSPRLVQARVQWALQDAEDHPLYDFDATYTLGRFGAELRIVQVISHNEIPRYHAMLRDRRGGPLHAWDSQEIATSEQPPEGQTEPEYDLFRQRYPHALTTLVRYLVSEGLSDEQAARVLEEFMAAHEESAIIDAAVSLAQECLPQCHSIQALDVLGPRAWTSPTAFRYLAGQLRFYARANVREQGWALEVSVQLHDAIQRAVANAKRHHLGKSKTHFEEPSDFSWKAAKRPRLEYARILLWSADELLHPMATVVIDIHSAFHVPLFFLNTARTARAFDFVCFHCQGEDANGTEVRRSVGCVNSWHPDKKKFVLSRFDDGMVRARTSDVGRGVAAKKLFEEYLAKEDLMFAVDAKEVMERKGRSLRAV